MPYIGRHLSAENTIIALNELIKDVEGIFAELEEKLSISAEIPVRKPTRREVARPLKVHIPVFSIAEFRIHLPDFLLRKNCIPEVFSV